jgi:RimJ/RimL family protein N-acetyltransferase
MTNNCHSDFPPVPQYVESERLFIRPSERADAPYLKKWWNDPTITAQGCNSAGMQYDDEDIEAWFRRYVDKRDGCRTHFVICLRDHAQTPIGEFYIASDDRPGSVGVALILGRAELWGQGYAAEALQTYVTALFGTDFCGAVRLDTRVDNAHAIQMCQEVGFEVEHVWANGQFQTMILTEDAFRLKHTPQNQP